MEIDIDEALSHLESLVRSSKLTEAEREKHKKNLRAMRLLKQEWQQLKNKDNG